MPLYYFSCPSCGAIQELLVAFDAKPTCSDCNGKELQRLLSCPAPEGKTAGIIRSARAQAASEGHFSHSSRAERAKITGAK